MLIYEWNAMPEIWDELLLLLQEIPDDLLPVVDILGQHLLCNTPLIIHRASLRIRDMFIPDPGSECFSIPGFPWKNWSILTQKLFLSSRKYDPGCSSRIQILIFLPIPDLRSRGQKGAGGFRIRNTAIEKGTWRVCRWFRFAQLAKGKKSRP